MIDLSNYIYIYISMYKPTCVHKPKICNTDTQKRGKNPNITLKIDIKSQGKLAKEERNKIKPENSYPNGNKYIPINNYVKCKWTKS